MSGNRVEELEAKVRKLEATIEGLTDELVETKERLRAVEEETGVQPRMREGRRTDRNRSTESEAEPSADAETTAEGETTESETDDDTTDSDSGSGDDIIVA